MRLSRRSVHQRRYQERPCEDNYHYIAILHFYLLSIVWRSKELTQGSPIESATDNYTSENRKTRFERIFLKIYFEKPTRGGR
jgi:hypothetical protein